MAVLASHHHDHHKHDPKSTVLVLAMGAGFSEAAVAVCHTVSLLLPSQAPVLGALALTIAASLYHCRNHLWKRDCV